MIKPMTFLAFTTLATAVQARVPLDANGPAVACLTGVYFDGACRDKTWVRDQMAGGKVVQHLADCGDAPCDLAFSVVQSRAVGDTSAEHTLLTYLVSEDTCLSGEACLGGYAMVARTRTEVTVDAPTQSVAGTVTLHGSSRQLSQGGIQLVPRQLGYGQFFVGSGYTSVMTFDPDGALIGGYLEQAFLGSPSSWELFCENLVDGFVAAGIGAGSVGAGALTKAAIESIVIQIAAAEAVSGPEGFPTAAATVVYGEMLANGAGATASVTAAAALLTLANVYDLNAICDQIDPNDSEGTPCGEASRCGPAPTGPMPLPELPELQGDSCWVCAEYSESSEIATFDEESGEVVVEYSPGGCIQYELRFGDDCPE